MRTVFATTFFVLFAGMTSPGRAEPRGGIEIGARGVKAVALEVGPRGELKLLWTASENVGLAAGLAERGSFDPKAVAAAADAVKKFTRQLTEEQHVAERTIIVAGSSGLFSALKEDAEKIRLCREQLSLAIKSASGRDVVFVSAKQEAELGIAAAIPPERFNTAAHIDIGSGNTKGGCRCGDGVVTFSLPMGTTTFSEHVKKAGGEFADRAAELGQSELAPAIKEHLTRAGVRERPHLYLSGGVVWAVATIIRPADRSTYTRLTADDFATFEQQLRAATEIPTPNFATIPDEAARKAAEKDTRTVQKIFTRDQLLAAVQILKAIVATTGTEKDMLFVRDGHVGWIAALTRDGAPR